MKKYFLNISPILMVGIAPLSVISCFDGKDNGEKKEPEVKKSRTELTFTLAQGQNWPLAVGIKPLVKYYNETFKNEKNFKPIKLQFAEETKVWSEFGLIKKARENFELKNYDALPNMVLGAQSGAYVINQDRRLMDLSDVGINKQLFNESIANLHSKLSGQAGSDKVYSIPFDNADVDSVVYNLDLLNLMFTLIKQGGGTVDENADIVKRATEAGKQGVGNEIPENSIWKALKLKQSDVFKDFKVNAETFESIKGIRDFAVKFHQGVILEESKVNEKTITGEILSIDYEQDTFIKELHANLPDDQSIFELTNEKGVNRIKYNLVKDQNVRNKFTELWKTYESSVLRHSKTVQANNKSFQSVKYMESGSKEWGSWNIREYKSAISYAASVGANQNKITPWSKAVFGKNNPDFDKLNAKDADVFMAPQLTLAEKGKTEIFNEGGSSILAIDVNNKEDNDATKAFIKWLYLGKNKILDPNVEEDNWKTFAKTTGYIVPMKHVINNETASWFKSEIERLEKLIKEQGEKAKPNDISTLNYLRSSLISIESILKLESKDKKVIAKAISTNDKTAEIIGKIANSLYKQTLHENPEKTSAETLLKSFEQIVEQ